MMISHSFNHVPASEDYWSIRFPCVDTCGSISCALVYKLFKTTHTITNIDHNKCFLAIIAKTLGSTHDGRLL